jgi:hypothetical protein
LWWHGEWQAENDANLVAAPPPPSYRGSDLTKIQTDYLKDLARNKDAPGGLLVDAPTMLTTGLNADGTTRSAALAVKMFSRIVVQTPGSRRHGDTPARFPFGRSNIPGNLDPTARAAWLSYNMPESSWGRLRLAQGEAVKFLRAQGLESILVSSQPTQLEADLPQQWIWTQGNVSGYSELATRLVKAAVFSMIDGEAIEDGRNPAPLPDVSPTVNGLGTGKVVVKLPLAADGKLIPGTAIVEVHNQGDQADRWSAVPMPDIVNHELTFISSTPLDGLRYAWSDAPGQLHAYTPASGENPVILPPFLKVLSPP